MVSPKSGEFRGKTVESATSAGLASLGISREQAEVEIIRPGSRGLLGIGAEEAVVRVTALSAPAQRAEPRSAPVAPRPEPTVAKAEGRTRRESAGAAPGAESTGESAGRTAPAKTVASPQPSVSARDEGEGVGQPSGAAGRNSLEMGQQMLTELLARMGLKASVQIVAQSAAETDDEEPAEVLNVVGEELEVLIGRQSEVLSSLQFILRLMVNQATHSRSNLVVDVNGYKAKRAEALRKLALRTADQVLQTGRTMGLEPMSPAERRIIHLTLRNHPQVSTLSVGEGNRRKVTIVPKKD
jgi:spoIIIJ-associated protein